MRKIISLFLVLVVCTSADVTISDIKFTEKYTYESDTFILNGAGVREKYYIDLYVLGLYLKSKSSDVDKILNANEPQLFKLVCVSGLITSEKFNNAMVNAFYNATDGHPEVYADEIERLKKAFSGTWNENDEFIIYYTPERGLELYKNSKLMDTINSGMGFKSAIMKVWLGPESVSESLKEQILGND
tara:strand:+ start:1571 stop:2131 length:561 start_codon:yes stop_codon:yes gene_type:complete